MCDTYWTTCTTCTCELPMHIGDWSTERENVRPYCPKCSEKLAEELGLDLVKIKVAEHRPRKIKERLVFISKVPREAVGYPGLKRGQKVIIVCTDETAYDVHLNL